MTENSTSHAISYIAHAPSSSNILDGPDSHAAYGSDVLPGETVGEYKRRKEQLAQALRSET